MSPGVCRKQAICPVIVVALLSFATPVAHAQNEGVLVEGVADCGLWVSARKQGNRASNLEHFLTGLLNGLALGRGVEFWRASGSQLSREQVYLWMDGYCAKNPLMTVYSGAYSLMDEHTKGAFSKKLGR